MKNIIRNIAITAAALLTVGTTIAANSSGNGGLTPMQAHTVHLEDYTAVVYYTKTDNDTFQVTTTVGPNLDVDGHITRHEAVVRSGDKYVFSFDTGVVGSQAAHVDFVASKGKLVVAE